MEAEYPDQWEALARDELEVAQALLERRKWKQAHHHAGIAIECALKCKIMRVERLNRWPDRSERRDIWTHDLEKLLTIAKLDTAMNADLVSSDVPQHALAWLIIKDWDINLRYYVPEAFPQRIAESAVEAAGEMGLVEWLLR